MRPSEMLNKITSILGTKVDLAMMKLENGTTIEADSFEGGESVFIITEDEKVPLPIGDYNLEDGKVLIVEEEGIIASIGDVTEAEEEKEQELSEEEIVSTGKTEDVEAKEEESEEPSEEKEELSLEEEEKDEMNKIVEEVVAAVTPIIDEMKQELAYVKEELGKMKDEDMAKDEEKEELKQQLSTEPATKPLKHNPESKPESKALLSKGNRPLGTMDRVLSKLNQ